MEKFQSTVLLPWPYDHQVSSAVWELGSLYIGTSSGYIFRFNSSDLKKTILEIPKNTIRVSNGSVEALYLMTNSLIVFCEGTIYSITKLLSSKSETGVKAATAMCEKRAFPPSDDEKTRYFAIASIQSISIYKYDVYLEFVRAIPVSSTHIISLTWVNDAIAYVSKTGYYSVNTSSCTENIISDVMEEGHLLALSPSMADEIMIICQNNIGIFYNLKNDRLSNRNTISWKSELIQIGTYPPYMIGVTSDGSVEIYSIRTQQLYQTLHVGNFKKLIVLPDHEFVISTTDTALFGFYSDDYYTRLLNLFKAKKVKEALELFNIYSNKDENYEQENRLFHLAAGLVYFNNLEFARAFQHFTIGPPNLNYLLNFWSDYTLPVDYQLEIPHGLDSLASKPMPINEFIKSKINDSCDKLEANRLKSLANSCLASFLLEQRKEFRPLDEMTRIDTLCFMLLAESDDKRYQLFCQPDRFVNYVNPDQSHEFLTKNNRLDIVAQLLFGTGNFLRASEIISSIEIDSNNLEMLAKCIVELSNYIESLGKIHSSRSSTKTNNSTLNPTLDVRSSTLEAFNEAPNVEKASNVEEKETVEKAFNEKEAINERATNVKATKEKKTSNLIKKAFSLKKKASNEKFLTRENAFNEKVINEKAINEKVINEKFLTRENATNEKIQLQPMQLELKSRIEYYLTVLLKNVGLSPSIVSSVFRYQRIFAIFTIDEMLTILNQAKNTEHSPYISQMITHFLEAFVASDVSSPGKEAILASHYLENAINGQRKEVDLLLKFIEGNVTHLGDWLTKVSSNQIVDFSKIKSCTVFQKEIISIAANGIIGNHELSFRDMIRLDGRLISFLGFPSREIMFESYSICYYNESTGKKPFLTNRIYWMELSFMPIKSINNKIESINDIFHLLLKILLEENMKEFAESLLDKYARTQVFDPLEVLKILPDDIQLSKISKYFLHSYKVTVGNINMAKIQLGLELGRK